MFPLLVQPNELERRLGGERLLIVDLCDENSYRACHIPGALHLDYADIITARPPAMGLLPAEYHLNQVLSNAGFAPQFHVVAYDAGGNGRACRFLWTLEVLGCERFSLLDGGLKAWLAEERPVESGRQARQPHSFRGEYQPDKVADKAYILDRLSDPNVVVLDSRSPAEYRGEQRRAQRGGHIPGAVNLEWTRAIDREHDGRFKPKAELRPMLESLGVTPDKEIICHCQTHQRSAHTYMVLKYLGYPQVKGYPGSWSEWGNDPATPVET